MLDLIGLGALAEPEGGVEADQRAQELLDQREQARAAREFESADRIRGELAELGWDVRDSAEGAKLVRRG